jgi:16S rRNA G1207 methylase RsmC
MKTFSELHQVFLAKQSRFATYKVNGLNIIALANVYHPDTESSSLFLLKPILQRYQNLKTKKKRLLDIGCGTGVVGLSLSKYVEDLYLSDVGSNAVLCARINSFINFKSAKIYQSDLFTSLPDLLFDVITFNLPLLHQNIESTVELATNDPNGQIFIKFVEQLSLYLKPQGEVFFTYSTLGDLELIKKIPQCFDVEKLAIERDEETGIERYVFKLIMN